MATASAEFKKYFPENFELETTRVLIRPMVAEDLSAFRELAKAKDIWTYYYKDLSNEEELKTWVELALEEKAAGTRMPFTITDLDTKEICGSSSFGNISFYDKRIEIGWTWLGSAYIGMGVNKHVKFALMSYAFEVMKMERVEAKTDVLSERAKGGLLKAGMIPEGVLRSHTLMHGGRRRDTIYFSMLRNEWPERRASFFSEMI